MPQKVCGGYILHVMAYAFFPEMPQIEHIHSRFFSRFKNDQVFFLEMPHFFMFVFAEMPHFSHLILKMRNMGYFKIFEHKKVGHFEKKACDQF